MNGISQRWSLAFQFTAFPGAALFPREGTCRSKPLWALCVPPPQAGSLPTSPAFCGRGVWAPSEGWEMSQSPCLASVLCGFLKASIELRGQILCFFFHLPTRSGTETINSFHLKSHSQLKSAIATSASRFLPTESAVPAPTGMKVPVFQCERGFLFRKQEGMLPLTFTTHFYVPSWRHINLAVIFWGGIGEGWQ